MVSKSGGFIYHFDWQKMYNFIWKFRLEAPPSLQLERYASL